MRFKCPHLCIMCSLPLLCLWSITCVSCILWLISTYEYIPCMSFCDWLTTLRIIISRSIHLPVKLLMSLVFNSWLVFRCLGVQHLLHPHLIWSTSRLLQFLATTNKAVWLRVGHIAGSWGRSIPSFINSYPVEFQIACTSLHSHQQWRTVPLPPHPDSLWYTLSFWSWSLWWV